MFKKNQSQNFIEIGKRVVRIEARALAELENEIGESFSNAIELILNVNGRVILSGMGKSGHIARKITATLTSTGTPANFLHPAEASHGDLGMITDADVLVLLSNSGETPELANIISYSKRFKVPLIGIASNLNSSLLKNANIPILLPETKEACNSGIVPTTSTTMALALGDAIAITLMEFRKFTPESFKIFHPGGNLGSALVTIENLMHKGQKIPKVFPGTSMVDVYLEMSKKWFGTVAIAKNKDVLVGVITDCDLRRNIDGLMTKSCDQILTSNPHVVTKDMLASSALNLMNKHKISSVFVVNKKNQLFVFYISMIACGLV